MVYYFAYGSNMDENRMKQRVNSYEIIGQGTLKNYKLVFNKIAKNKLDEGYANIISKNSFLVEGIIYKIDTDGIKQLDKYEGVPIHYKRELMAILHNNEVIISDVYIANKDKIDNNLKPTKQYLNYLLEGQKYLSKEYFENLKNIITLD